MENAIIYRNISFYIRIFWQLIELKQLFVVDNQDNVLFADRESSDVYRHIHVDAYASVVPIIDIDLNKYRAYVKKR